MNDETTPPLRETLLSYLAGTVFAIAWWIWIDAHAYASIIEDGRAAPGFPIYLPGIVSTIALIMVNTVSWQDLGGLNWGFSDDNVQGRVRLWFFFSLVVAFCGIIAALWVGIDHWFNNPDQPTIWPGIALILQNVLIFVSGMLFKFGKPIESADNSMQFTL